MALVSSRTVRGRCLVCGGEHVACGPPSSSTPADQMVEEVAAVGGPLKKYTVVTPSGAETVMKLSEADAERLGATLLEPPVSTLDLPEDEPDPSAPVPAKKRAAPNKARRTAASKDGAGGGDN